MGSRNVFRQGHFRQVHDTPSRQKNQTLVTLETQLKLDLEGRSTAYLSHFLNSQHPQNTEGRVSICTHYRSQDMSYWRQAEVSYQEVRPDVVHGSPGRVYYMR